MFAAGAAREAPSRRNVVLIVADDMNCALGCYGNPHVRSPYLDRLASRGVVFDNAHCQHPLCAPSRASFLSSTRPETNGVISLTVPTRQNLKDWIMLPQLFRSLGYFTAEVGKIFHTGPDHEDPQSWDFRLPEWGKTPPKEEILKEHVAGEPRNHTMSWHVLRTPDEKTPDGEVARKAAALIRECHARKQPFFMGAGFRRPHAPYAAPKKYFDLYDPARLSLPPRRGVPDLPAAWYELENQPPLSEREQREYLAAYYACNSFVDAQVGVILETLDQLKLWDNTVVVFLSDNGYHTGEHGMWHKMTLFEESTRVPFIIAAPGARGNGKRAPGIVELLDLYPTITELCGVKPPPGLEGMSLAPLLDDPGRPGKQAAYTMVGRHRDRSLSHQKPEWFGRSVRTERWRYTEWDGGRKGRELYDRRADPGETRNLAGDPRYSSAIDEMRKLLAAVPYRFTHQGG